MWDKDIVEWKIKSRCLCLALDQDFATGRGLEPKVKSETSALGGAMSKLVQLKYITAAGQFFAVFWKTSYFNADGSHFASVQSNLK